MVRIWSDDTGCEEKSRWCYSAEAEVREDFYSSGGRGEE